MWFDSNCLNEILIKETAMAVINNGFIKNYPLKRSAS